MSLWRAAVQECNADLNVGQRAHSRRWQVPNKFIRYRRIGTAERLPMYAEKKLVYVYTASESGPRVVKSSPGSGNVVQNASSAVKN